MRATVGVMLLLALSASGCARLGLFRRAEPPPPLTSPGTRVGYLAPDLDGEDFEGKRLRLSDYRGKIVVVSFWGSYCTPCLRLIPHERALVERYKDKSVVLLGVNSEENMDAARQTIARCNMTWRNCKPDGRIVQAWGVTGLPRVFVIDGAGVVRYAGANEADLDRTVAVLVAEQEKKQVR
jgi:thiol-disulfide isomerase/thioredoxin